MCNRLNEAKIREAVAAGAVTPEEVFAYHRVRKNCGRCLETIEEMADEADEKPARLALQPAG
ncbi:MAG: (2Fe-2S)-binding protein [bacterium]